MPIKGKQIQDDSLELKKLSSGVKILDNASKLGVNKTPAEFTDPNEYITKAYVDDLSDDVDAETIIVDGAVLKVNLKTPVDADEIAITVDGTNGIKIDKVDITSSVIGGLGLDSTIDGSFNKTLDVKALNVAPSTDEVKVRFGTAGDLVIDYDDFSDKLDKVDGTAQTIASDVTFNSNLTVVGSANFQGNALTTKDINEFTSNNELVSKGYVDSIAQGLDWKESALFATDIDLNTGWTYTADPSGSSTSGFADTLAFTSGIAGTDIDSGSTSGISIGDRFLIKNQSDANQNGIYELTAADTLTRASDHDGSPASEISGGNAIFIESGTYVNTGWVLQGEGNLTPNTDPLTWIQFSGTGAIIAGAGLLKTGDTFDVELATNSGLEFDAVGDAGKLQIDAKAPASTDVGIQLTGGVHLLKSDISATVIDGTTLTSSVDGDGIKTLDVDLNSVATTFAGNGLGDATGSLEVNVDDTTIEIVTDTLRVKADGINDTHIDFGTAGTQVNAGDLPTTTYTWAGSAIDGDSIQNILQALDTDIAAGDITTASNGLTEVGNDIQLGGALTSSTTIGGTGIYNLTFNDLATATIEATTIAVATSSGYALNMNGTATFTDTTNTKGLEYAADYSANFTSNSLVTKAYVDANSSLNSTTAGNGLTLNGDAVELGGTLDKNTTIAGGSFNLTFNDLATATIEATTIAIATSSGYSLDMNGAATFTDIGNSKGIEYAADYSTNFTDRSLVDKGYVDTEIGNITQEATTADNGLTETGDNIQLGGALTQNTIIDGTGIYNLSFNNLNTATIDASTIAIATSSGYSLDMNGTATFTDTGNSKGIEYAADYSTNFTDRSLVDKGYVDTQLLEASTSGLSAWDTIEVTGSNVSGTSGLVSYLGSITFADAIDEATVYVNGVRLEVPSEASFGTSGEAIPAPGDTLYFDLDVLGYDIDSVDKLMITYLTK